MQPPDPDTSLELTFEQKAPQPASTNLELPPSAAPPPPPEVEPVAGHPAPLGNLVVAHFRRVEIAMLGRVLVATLSGVLPASMVRVERGRSFRQRLTGRAGEPIGITVTAGERVLTFRTPEVGVVEAGVGHSVRGVVLSTTPVPVAQWLDELGVVLDGLTRDDEATRLALERALLNQG